MLMTSQFFCGYVVMGMGMSSFNRRITIVGSRIGNGTQFKYFKGLIGCATLIFFGLLLAQRDL